MAIELLQTATGAILYDSSCVGKPKEEMFEEAHWSAQHKIVARATGRGAVIFIRDDDRHWVLRHYRRGGFVGKIIRDRYWWSTAERTRAFREWRLLHALHLLGLSVPAPVATRYIRNGFIYRADLITESLPATRTLADSITGAALIEEQWLKVGATVAQFHRNGVYHADLNAHNILLGAGGATFIVDFDRGRIRARGAWERKVLARLERSLLKIRRERRNVNFGEREWVALLKGYEDALQSR
jgi:3-deoxy-D-manno-octulosonic acid kinase